MFPVHKEHDANITIFLQMKHHLWKK